MSGVPSERLLISARAADQELWANWFAGTQPRSYAPPSGLLLVEYNGVEQFAPLYGKVKKLLELGRLPIVNGGCVLSPAGKRPVYIRAERLEDGYLIAAALYQDGGWMPAPPLWLKMHPGGNIQTAVLAGHSTANLTEEYVADFAGLLFRYVAAAIMTKREERTFSLARRAAVAKSGWKGIRYEVARLDQRTTVSGSLGIGTHAAPVFHWVIGHFRMLKSGKEIWVDPHHRGDRSKGAVIKDWVRAAGLDKAA
jgi:hypothetical protein